MNWRSSFSLCSTLCWVLPAGAWRAPAQPDGADGENPSEEQKETPQKERKHQEETVRAGFQHLQRLLQCVWAFVSKCRCSNNLYTLTSSQTQTSKPCDVSGAKCLHILHKPLQQISAIFDHLSLLLPSRSAGCIIGSYMHVLADMPANDWDVLNTNHWCPAVCLCVVYSATITARWTFINSAVAFLCSHSCLLVSASLINHIRAGFGAVVGCTCTPGHVILLLFLFFSSTICTN